MKCEPPEWLKSEAEAIVLCTANKHGIRLHLMNNTSFRTARICIARQEVIAWLRTHFWQSLYRPRTFSRNKRKDDIRLSAATIGLLIDQSSQAVTYTIKLIEAGKCSPSKATKRRSR